MAGWALTGRSEELAFIADRCASDDGARGVVIAGPAGVGKTRLAREVLSRLRARGAATRWVSATESARAIVLGAFASLLSVSIADAARVVGDAVDQLVNGAQGAASLVIGVDDGHLLDPISALLVQQLVLRGVATLVMTLRTGVPTLDTVRSLWKDEHLDRLELQPLSESELDTLLCSALGAPVETVTVRRMWALTRGNVLFLRHLVDGELSAGRLSATGGLWRWNGEPVVSPVLTDLIVDQMGSMTPPERDIVDLCWLGEPLDVSVLASLRDPAALELAEARGLVTVERHRGVHLARLAHPLYGEVRRTQVGGLQARRLRGELAGALSLTPDSDPRDLLRRAVLVLDSDLSPDARVMIAAAYTASLMVDLELAERLARAAISAGGGFDCQLMLAQTLSFQNRAKEAEAQLVGLDEVARDDLERSMVAFTRAANLLWTAGRPSEAAQVLDAARPTITDERFQGALDGLLAALYSCVGRPQEAVELATRTLARSGVPPLGVMGADYGLVAGLGVLGRANELAAASERGYALAREASETAFLQFGLSYMHVNGLRLAGSVNTADAVALDCYRRSLDMPGPAQLCASMVAGAADLAAGRIRSAQRSLRQVRAGLLPADTQGFGFVCLLLLTESLALAGEHEQAAQTLTELKSRRHAAFAYMAPELTLVRAWVAASAGATGQAIVLARQAATEAASLGQSGQELFALHTATRFGDRSGSRRLVELAPRVDGPRAAAAVLQSQSLEHDDGDGLSAASELLAGGGDLLAAADASAQAATAYQHHGHVRQAKQAATRMQQLADRCEGPSTPAITIVQQPSPLTRREREIATLAARGLSSREIAQRLTVSVRTVEGHLYNAAAKLGTRSRTELAAALGLD